MGLALIKPSDGNGGGGGDTEPAPLDRWAPSLGSPSLVATKIEELYDADALDGLGLGKWLDGTGGLVVLSDGRSALFSCDLDTSEIIRTIVDPDTGDPVGSPIRVTPSGVPGGAIALGGKVFYTGNDRHIMVTHTNRSGTNGGLWSSVGIMSSSTDGASWTWVDDAITPNIAISSTLPGGVGDNVIGSFSSAVFDRDPEDGTWYLVVFHSDRLVNGTVIWQTASRANLTDLIAEVLGSNDLSEMFFKWDGSTFGAAGIGGVSANISTAPRSLHTEVLSIAAGGEGESVGWPGGEGAHAGGDGPPRGFIRIDVDSSGEGSTALVSWSQRPEGPWSEPTDPYRHIGRPEGAESELWLYGVTYGSDPAWPFDLLPDGEVTALILAQPSIGEWEGARLLRVTLEPAFGELPATVEEETRLDAIEVGLCSTRATGVLIDLAGFGVGSSALSGASDLFLTGGASVVFSGASSGPDGVAIAAPAPPIPGAKISGARVVLSNVVTGSMAHARITLALFDGAATYAGSADPNGNGKWLGNAFGAFTQTAVSGAATIDLRIAEPVEALGGVNPPILLIQVLPDGTGTITEPTSIAVDSIYWIWEPQSLIGVLDVLGAAGAGGTPTLTPGPNVSIPEWGDLLNNTDRVQVIPIQLTDTVDTSQELVRVEFGIPYATRTAVALSPINYTESDTTSKLSGTTQVSVLADSYGYSIYSGEGGLPELIGGDEAYAWYVSVTPA